MRECVIAVPADLSEAVKTRLVEAAQAGGKNYSYELIYVHICAHEEFQFGLWSTEINTGDIHNASIHHLRNGHQYDSAPWTLKL